MDHYYLEWENSEKHLPIPHNLDLSSMCAKELYIWIGMVEERYNQPPCFKLFLYLDELLLDAPLIYVGLCGGISLLYQL